MKILLLDRLEANVLDAVLADHVVYRPDVLRKGTTQLHRVVLENQIDAILTSRAIPDTWIKTWTVSRSTPLYLLQIEVGTEPAQVTYSEKQSDNGRLVRLWAQGADEMMAYIRAFTLLEETFTAYELNQRIPTGRRAASSRSKRVLMVGAGVVNLITAYTLQQAGYEVKLVDAGPDPRANALWTAYGCSRAGGDARMFTLSEMDNYHDKEISPAMNSQFRRHVAELGWNIYGNAPLSKREQRWVETFEDIPAWLARRYNEDIFAFNRENRPLWDDWIEKEPALFTRSILCNGILRLYSDEKHYASAVQRQNHIGATERLLTPECVASEHPALADAVAGGHIAGGIHVIGFTVNIHKFMHLLLDRLEERGASFEWMQMAKDIIFDAEKRAMKVTGTDIAWEEEDFVISPGAFGNALLTGTRSQDKIHGVLGGWLELPNIEPQLTHSLKLARKGHVTEDANITIATDQAGRPILIIGSGYGYTGLDPRNIDQALLDHLYCGIFDTAEKYFPRAYRDAREKGCLEESLRYCVRPWTATGLGLFEILPTRHGGLCIITGGHNTGGFTQAPAVAQAVLAALNERQHPMHSLYHPERGYAFVNRGEHQQAYAERSP